ADRLVVMNAGRIEQTGTPLEIYQRPQTLFVASFMGSPGMNLMPMAELAASGADLSGENAAVLGCRPEHVGLEPQAGEIAIPARVEAVELAGSETLVHLGADGIGSS